MVLIRTFRDEFQAGAAQAELRASGIPSLLFMEEIEPTPPGAQSGGGVHLAVHQRDQGVAEAVLKAVIDAG